MDTKPLIAASIGPYGAYLADGSEYHGNYNVTNEAIHQFHKSRLEILSHSAADILAIETIPSIMETTVLSDLLRDSPKPAWISFSCKDENHLNDGSRIEDSVAMLENHPTIFAIGVNCTHPKYISDLIQTIKSVCSNKKILVYPNSGEVYDAKTKKWLGLSEPLAFAKMSQQWIQLGADIIGGCCRIGPDQIESIASNFSK
jgi:homocysteine S-methyltransferase